MTQHVRLYLARHGRTAWNAARRFQGKTDIPLDEVGRAQALALAAELRGRVAAVISSDLTRASESAQIIASALELPLLAVDPDLRERGYGVFEGLSGDECNAQYPRVWASRELDRNYLPPGGEPHADVIARMHRGLERAVALLAGRHASALVVGHGSSLRMFLETLSGRPEASLANLQVRQVLHDGHRFALADDAAP